jgi:hypothetical protein
LKTVDKKGVFERLFDLFRSWRAKNIP